MSTQYEFEFAIRDTVVVSGLSASGRVVAVMRCEDGCQYRVVYWINNERRDQWMFEYEIYKYVPTSERLR